MPRPPKATSNGTKAGSTASTACEAGFGLEHADTFRRDLGACYVVATAGRDSALLNAKSNYRACRRQDNTMPFNDSDTTLRGGGFL